MSRFCRRSTTAPASASGSLKAQHTCLRGALTAFSRQLGVDSVGPYERCPAGRTIFATAESIGAELSAIRQQRHLCIRKQLDLADQPVASSELPCATRSNAIGVAPHAKRISELQRLNWSVQRVRHVGLHTGDAIEAGSRAHAARRSLVV